MKPLSYKLLPALVVAWFATLPVTQSLAMDKAAIEAHWRALIKDQHSAYCRGKPGACNVCEVKYKGRFLGDCQTDVSGPLGSDCRCGSSEGWMKGYIVKLDPVEGWIDADGKPRRTKGPRY